MYSNIRSRAGLVALVLALISISLVSALPIPSPATQSPSPSNPSYDGQNHIQHDIRRIEKFSLNGQISRAPSATSDKHNAMPVVTYDDQLVRRNIFSKIKHAFQSFGHKVKAGFQKLGQGIKHVAQKAVAGIKTVAKKVGSGIKTAVKKVGHFIKTTGAKIVKFGLKVVQAVGTAVAKVASFIPEVGKPLERAIDGVAKGAGMISDKIHVKLPPRLEKGVEVMNKADKIMEYIPRRRDLSDEEAFQQRDINDKYHSEEFGLDDISLASEHLHLNEESDVDDDYEHWE